MSSPSTGTKNSKGYPVLRGTKFNVPNKVRPAAYTQLTHAIIVHTKFSTAALNLVWSMEQGSADDGGLGYTHCIR